jgi:hypothetical protein
MFPFLTAVPRRTRLLCSEPIQRATEHRRHSKNATRGREKERSSSLQGKVADVGCFGASLKQPSIVHCIPPATGEGSPDMNVGRLA